MQFGVEQGVDWMALSFVRRAEDVRELRRLIIQEEEKIGSQSAPILIMTKIEKPEAIEYFDEILAETDGIMVARGDLGVEIAPEKVPVLQKEMIEKCLLAAKPVVVATQMFESMIHEPHPTRAEVSDVANAVIDHTDATMLSGETAIGHFPVEAVAMMSATICETEESRFDDLPIQIEKERMQNQAMTNIASALVQARSAKAILVATLSGHAARLVSRYRPEVPIFAVTPHERVVRQLNASWGVHGILIPTCATLAELLDQSVGALKRLGVVQSGDDLIVVAGEPLGTSGHVNLVEWWKV